eukprot:2932915-Amphidinium_carterae.1
MILVEQSCHLLAHRWASVAVSNCLQMQFPGGAELGQVQRIVGFRVFLTISDSFAVCACIFV